MKHIIAVKGVEGIKGIKGVKGIKDIKGIKGILRILFLSLILCAIAVTAYASVPTGWANYEWMGATATDGDWEYDINVSTNTAAIYAYTGSATSITIPAIVGGVPVDVVSGGVFSGQLTDVTLSSGIKYLDGMGGNRSLKTLTLPASVSFLGDYTFEELYAETVIFGASGSVVEAAARKAGLCFVELGQTSSAIFGADGDFTYMVVNNEATITGYTGTGSVLNIPQTVGGYPVRTIGRNAFFGEGMDVIVEVHVPEGVRSLGDRAFFSCWNMTRLDLPSTLQSIGYMSIGSCDGLTSLILPEGLLSIGANALSQCNALTSLTIPSTVKEIGAGAFSWIPCTKLTIPYGVTELNDWLFWGCSITELVIPDSVTRIGESTFSMCYNLRQIVIPISVTQIDDGAFDFGGSTAGGMIVVICGYKGSEAERFANKGGFPFAALDKPTDVLNLPSNVKTVDQQALSGTNAEAVYVPSDCDTIASQAFSNCPNLRAVHIDGNNTEIDEHAFDGCSNPIVIYSHAGSAAQSFAEENGYVWFEE